MKKYIYIKHISLSEVSVLYLGTGKYSPAGKTLKLHFQSGKNCDSKATVTCREEGKIWNSNNT